MLVSPAYLAQLATPISGSVGSLVAVVTVVVVLIAVIWILFKNSKWQKFSRQRRETTQAALEKKVKDARTQLLYADETVRTAKDEISFASIEFGVTSLDQLKSAITTAEQGLASSYQLLARIDAAASLNEQAQLAEGIARELNRVLPPLSTALEQLQAQRNAQASVESRAVDLGERITDTERKVSSAESELRALQAAYSKQAIASLLDNPAQARQLLRDAKTTLEEMRQVLRTDKSLAVQKAELCQHQVVLAQLQIDAITNARQTIQNAGQMLTGAIGSITQDLSDVSRLAADQKVFQPLVDEAHAAIEQAQQAVRGEGDALVALERIHNAEEALDAALEPLRSAEEARNRTIVQTRERINQVEILVNQADSEIQRRRSNLSLEARSDIAQARSGLEKAKQVLESDPQQALQSVANAERLARLAIQKAQTSQSYSWDFDMSNPWTWATMGTALEVIDGALDMVSQFSRRHHRPKSFGSPHKGKGAPPPKPFEFGPPGSRSGRSGSRPPGSRPPRFR